jgi:hypothetical protein
VRNGDDENPEVIQTPAAYTPLEPLNYTIFLLEIFPLAAVGIIVLHVGRDLLIPSSESYLWPLSPHLNLAEVRAFLSGTASLAEWG